MRYFKRHEGFQLLELIGQGGYADVYKARDVESGVVVAVKMLRDCHPDGLVGFRRELKVLMSRVHPNIVEVLAVNLECDTPYYAMPLYENGSLEKWAGRLPKANMRRLAQTLGEALAEMHRAQMVHGDIKPENVLVDKDGVVRHSDPLGNGQGVTVSFGTKWGGTAGYMAPEIAHGNAPITEASDAFSFGALLFHMVSGIHPSVLCDGTMSPGQLDIAKPVAGRVRWSLRSASGWANDPLRDVVWSLTEPDPCRRATLAQVVEFLATKGEPPAPPPPPSKSGWELLADFAGAAVVVAGLGLAGVGLVSALGSSSKT